MGGSDCLPSRDPYANLPQKTCKICNRGYSKTKFKSNKKLNCNKLLLIAAAWTL